MRVSNIIRGWLLWELTLLLRPETPPHSRAWYDCGGTKARRCLCATSCDDICIDSIVRHRAYGSFFECWKSGEGATDGRARLLPEERTSIDCSHSLVATTSAALPFQYLGAHAAFFLSWQHGTSIGGIATQRCADFLLHRTMAGLS